MCHGCPADSVKTRPHTENKVMSQDPCEDPFCLLFVSGLLGEQEEEDLRSDPARPARRDRGRRLVGNRNSEERRPPFEPQEGRS